MEHGDRDNKEKSRGEATVTEDTYPQEGFRLRSKQKGIKELNRNVGRPINPDKSLLSGRQWFVNKYLASLHTIFRVKRKYYFNGLVENFTGVEFNYLLEL